MQREEMKHLVGQRIGGVTATLAERSGGIRGYGYLLSDVQFPDGTKTDHIWVGGGEGNGCCKWRKGTACLGYRIRFEAEVHTYVSEGSARRGRYEQSIGLGIVSSEIEIGVESELWKGWMPMPEAVKILAKSNSEARKSSKSSPDYVWPGSWTYATGELRVKAAKSANAGSKCSVRSRNGMNDKTVTLKTQEVAGIWSFVEVVDNA